SGDLAVNLVGDAHNVFMNRGTQTYNTAIAGLNAMDDIVLAPFEFSVSFDFDGQLTPFQRPQRPDIGLEELTMQPVEPPGPAPGFTGASLTFTTAPELNVAPPTLTFG